MPFNRPSTLAWLRPQPAVPVLIIGGGINGAGVLRELAINGVDALLIDRGDFASGASSASSRMIHGGLRYLEHGEFRLVRESLQERNRLLRNAPHAVFPLPTVIPLFSRFAGFGGAVRKFLRLGRSRPGRRGSWLVRIGLMMYASYAGADDPLPARRFTWRRRAHRERPGLHPAAIGTATYHDAWNPSPERLCVEVLADALRVHPGARALNYVSVTGVERDTITLRDELSGELLAARPQHVVNATGAWIDRTNRLLGHETAYIGGTKGSHMVVDHPDLTAQVRDAEIFYENHDGRICLMLPLHGRVLVGTTDLRVDDPDAARCEVDEMAYLASAVQLVFPGITILPQHVVSKMCGVRPLPRSEAGSTGEISRDHSTPELPPNEARPFPIVALVGGKWTTFRALAESVADTLLERIGKLRHVHSGHLPIGGGRDHPGKGAARERWIAGVVRETELPTELVAAWFDRHGTTAAAMARHAKQSGLHAAGRIHDWHDAVARLDDLVVRRTTLALFRGLDRSSLTRCAEVAARALGWSPGRIIEEVDRTERILRERHGIRL